MSYIALHTGNGNQHCTLAWWPGEQKLSQEDLRMMRTWIDTWNEKLAETPMVGVRNHTAYYGPFRDKAVAVLDDNDGITLLREMFSVFNKSDFPGTPHVTNHQDQFTFVFNEIRYHE
jgi:hypothetical protein